MTQHGERGATNSYPLSDVAKLVGGRVVGDGRVQITGLAGLSDAVEGDLVFAETARLFHTAMGTKAAAVMVSPDIVLADQAQSKPLILVEAPRLAFIAILEAVAVRPRYAAGIHATAVVDETAMMTPSASVGPLVTVGPGASLGERVVVLDGVRIGAGCKVGDDTILYPNVVLYPGVTVGARCAIHAGCVIGADGFGYIEVGKELRKVPHIGTVEIHDDVEIGANSCVDRAKTAATVIGAGTKIDNLVQVGHNVVIGRNCVVVSQVGLCGSCSLGDNVQLAGKVGISNQVRIGDGASIGPMSGVLRDVAAGEKYLGWPAKPHKVTIREWYNLAKLPQRASLIKELEARVAKLEGRAELEID